MIMLLADSQGLVSRARIEVKIPNFILITLYLLITCWLALTPLSAQTLRSLEETARREVEDRVEAYKFRRNESHQETRNFVKEALSQVDRVVDSCRLSGRAGSETSDAALIYLNDVTGESRDFQRTLNTSFDSIKSRYESVKSRNNRYCEQTQKEFGLWLDCLLRSEKQLYIALLFSEARYISDVTPFMEESLNELKKCSETQGKLTVADVKRVQKVSRIFHEELDKKMDFLRGAVSMFMEN